MSLLEMFIQPTRSRQDLPSRWLEKVVSAPTTPFPLVQLIPWSKCCCRIRPLQSCSGLLPTEKRSWDRPTDLSWGAQPESWCSWWEDIPCSQVEPKARPDESWAGFSHLMRSNEIRLQADCNVDLYINFSWKMQEELLLSRRKMFTFKWLYTSLQNLINWLGNPFPGGLYFFN